MHRRIFFQAGRVPSRRRWHHTSRRTPPVPLLCPGRSGGCTAGKCLRSDSPHDGCACQTSLSAEGKADGSFPDSSTLSEAEFRPGQDTNPRTEDFAWRHITTCGSKTGQLWPSAFSISPHSNRHCAALPGMFVDAVSPETVCAEDQSCNPSFPGLRSKVKNPAENGYLKVKPSRPRSSFRHFPRFRTLPFFLSDVPVWRPDLSNIFHWISPAHPQWDVSGMKPMPEPWTDISA